MRDNPILIYWGVNTSEECFGSGLRADAPIPILKKFIKDCSKKETDIKDLILCPAFKDEIKNVFGVKSYDDYSLNISSDGSLSTEDYDQKFFDNRVLIRSKGLISFCTNHTFFAPYENSLLFSLIHPYLEDSHITNDFIVIPGQFDIAKYFRSLDYAFMIKNNISSFKFTRDEIIYYVKFHTSRPIIFKQFFWDRKLNEYVYPVLKSKEYKYPKHYKDRILSYYYKMFYKFQFKKKIIKIIENNLTNERT